MKFAIKPFLLSSIVFFIVFLFGLMAYEKVLNEWDGRWKEIIYWAIFWTIIYICFRNAHSCFKK
jgi:hypothetical protein